MNTKDPGLPPGYAEQHNEFIMRRNSQPEEVMFAILFSNVADAIKRQAIFANNPADTPQDHLSSRLRDKMMELIDLAYEENVDFFHVSNPDAYYNVGQPWEGKWPAKPWHDYNHPNHPRHQAWLEAHRIRGK